MLPRNHSDEATYRLARQGLIPAEQLKQHLRWRLIAELDRQGWTIHEIAAHIRETPYTTARIRRELELRRIRVMAR